MKRKTNQDSIYLNDEESIYIVADGMGGHNGGDIASALAVEKMPEFFSSKNNLTSDEVISNHLSDSIQFANNSILLAASKNPELKGMGTTIVSAYTKENKVYIGNVGDSRAYLIHNMQLFQITRDHSLVQEKINMGIYTREEAVKDLMKNVLVKTVGYGELDSVDIFQYSMNPGDLLLLCSDGLHSKVSDKDILTIINQLCSNDTSQITPNLLNETTQNLVNQANKNGGNDNISVILLYAK